MYGSQSHRTHKIVMLGAPHQGKTWLLKVAYTGIVPTAARRTVSYTEENVKVYLRPDQGNLDCAGQMNNTGEDVVIFHLWNIPGQNHRAYQSNPSFFRLAGAALIVVECSMFDATEEVLEEASSQGLSPLAVGESMTVAARKFVPGIPTFLVLTKCDLLQGYKKGGATVLNPIDAKVKSLNARLFVKAEKYAVENNLHSTVICTSAMDKNGIGKLFSIVHEEIQAQQKLKAADSNLESSLRPEPVKLRLAVDTASKNQNTCCSFGGGSSSYTNDVSNTPSPSKTVEPTTTASSATSAPSSSSSSNNNNTVTEQSQKQQENKESNNNNNNNNNNSNSPQYSHLNDIQGIDVECKAILAKNKATLEFLLDEETTKQDFLDIKIPLADVKKIMKWIEMKKKEKEAQKKQQQQQQENKSNSNSNNNSNSTGTNLTAAHHQHSNSSSNNNNNMPSTTSRGSFSSSSNDEETNRSDEQQQNCEKQQLHHQDHLAKNPNITRMNPLGLTVEQRIERLPQTFRFNVDDIEILREKKNALLGTGGGGSVWQGKLKSTGWKIAVKRFNNSHLIQKALDECFISLKLRHPNLVTTHGIAIEHTRFSTELLMILELAECSLNHILAKYVLDFDVCHAFARQMAHGIGFLHSRSSGVDGKVLIHRDIKPANVLLFRREISNFPRRMASSAASSSP